MDYDFLFDKVRRQLVIGYNVGERRCDTSYYDLLASEARLCNFVAIAQGQLPQESWFALGRLLTTAGGEPVLLSWSGSMFEYLMPLLVMPTYENTLLDQTYQAAVERQIEYGRQRGVPWGMSESGYNTVDMHQNYQYRAFGVPGLGLKRGLGDDLVVAPYASALALMVAPEAACLNLQRLAGERVGRTIGLVRSHRLHAVAAAPRRVERGRPVVHGAPPGDEPAFLRLFAAGAADAKALRVGPALSGDVAAAPGAHSESHAVSFAMPPTCPISARPERPGVAGARAHQPGHRDSGSPAAVERPLPRDGHECRRREQPLERPGRVTRWREDGTSDNWGTFCYLRDEASGEFWSTAYQPTCKRPSTTRRSSRKGGRSFGAGTSISRRTPRSWFRLKTTSKSGGSTSQTGRGRPRTIEVTSYAEVVLAPAAADALHPAFSNLFVQTEIIQSGGQFCARAARAPSKSRCRGCSI